MKYFLFFLFVLTGISSFSQNKEKKEQGYLHGIIADETTKETVPYASVKILNYPDSSTFTSGTSDKNGKFKLNINKNQSYILEISFIGYKKYFKEFVVEKETQLDFGTIFLKEKPISLKEASVEAQVPDIVVKGDTIEYNAASYTSEESAMLQDIIKNIPGIEIDANGNITANGKSVTKILVDGKEFFGNDIQMALDNLPANMIKKLQLYKEESETAKQTGFKDKNPEQVLNLVVKEELKQSIFGELKTGNGSDDKYANKILANYMRNDNQASIIGDINNVSDNVLTIKDNGIDKNLIGGINFYVQSSKKLKIGGNIRYSDNENSVHSTTDEKQFLSSGDRISRQDLTSTNTRKSTNGGLTLQWALDSMTSIFSRIHINQNKINNNQNSTSQSYVAEKDTTNGFTNNFSKGNGYNLNNYLSISRKLNTKGRTINISTNYSIRNDKSNGTNFSHLKHSIPNSDKIIDQKSKTDNKINNYNVSLSYVEPIGKDYSMQFSYAYNNNLSERDRKVYKNDGSGNYNTIDSAYTRKTNNKYIYQNISLNFQANKEKYSYTVGFSIDPSRSSSKIMIGDSIIDTVKQRVVNYSPSINFSYQPKSTINIDFNYSGSTSQPSLGQLSPDTVIINALTKNYGNPDLKTSYSNNINFHFQKSDYESNQFLLIAAGLNYTFNNIVNYTLIDDLGNTTTTYQNLNGNMGASINMTYDTPLKNKKFSINTSSYGNYYKNIGFTNGEKAITHNIVLGEQLYIRFKNKIIETTLQSGVSYNIAKNNITTLQNNNTSTYLLKNIFSIKLPFDFSIQNNIQYTHYSGYSDNIKKNEILWNSSITKLFLRKKKGILKLQFFDILNDRNNISRIIKEDHISDTWTNTINRYFMLTFSYKFNIIKNNSNKKTTDDFDPEY